MLEFVLESAVVRRRGRSRSAAYPPVVESASVKIKKMVFRYKIICWVESRINIDKLR